MKHLKKTFLILLLSGYAFLLVIHISAYLLPLPTTNENERLQIFDINNEIYFESNFDKNSTWIDIENIPSIIKKAFITIEDRRFYNHYGLDPIRILKSLFVNLKSGSIKEGGSTITQQYARNLFLDQSKTITRKLKEAFHAIQIEMHYNKEQILEGYLNTLYFGHGIYGIQKASFYYFNKELNQLEPYEIALLVGICNAPSYYSPYLNFEQAKSKQLQILYTFFEQGLIDEHTYTIQKEKTLVVINHTNDEIQLDYSSFYKDCVIAQLSNLGYLSENSLNKGIKVYSYYTPSISQKLNKAIRANLPTDTNLQVSGIISQPYTGNILAIQGSSDYTKNQFNRALYSSRQIASTIKPLLYYLALESGFTPSTTFISQPTTFRISELESYSPTNFNETYAFDNIPMIHALSVSDNIYAVKTHLFLGTETLYNALQSMGYKDTKNIASLALGTVDMSVYELNQLYSTFASEGLYTDLSFIDKITDQHGTILYQNNHESKRILQRDTTLMINQLLRAPFDILNQSYTTPSLLGLEPLVITGAKSGTSDWDSWISGFNPDYSVTIWNGYDDNSPLTTSKERRVSRLIYRDVFNMLYNKEEDGPWYTMTDNLIARRINPRTGELDSRGSIYWYKQ